MRTVGLYLTLLGILSVIFYGLNVEISIFKWIDTWGETIGLILRAVIIMFGGWMLVKGNSKKDDDEKFEEWDEMKDHQNKK